MTRPHPAAARGTYIGLLRTGSRDAARYQERRPGSRLDRPLAPDERLTADGDRIRVATQEA
ncbi:hypothetical protein ACQVP2_22470 [Methylobacterium aquaticum]|uniref:hypothetical protein n=1 Tax=Methylobacterium aquaticum TaxID=270351 RepID=UPI003D17A12E